MRGFRNRTGRVLDALTAPAAACAFAYLSILLLLHWTRGLGPATLIAAAAAGAAALIVAGYALRPDARTAPGAAAGSRDRRAAIFACAAVGLIALGLTVAGGVHMRLSRMSADWTALRAEREARLADALDRQLTLALDRARRAAELAAERVSAPAAGPPEGSASERLAAVRSRAAVAALALVDADGELVAWAGDHRGALPRAVRGGTRAVAYAERPLFSYLYVTAPLQGRPGHVIAAVLMETGRPLADGSAEAVADRAAQRFGVRPEFAAGAADGAAWRLVQDGEVIVHATFPPATQAALRADLTGTGRGAVLGLAGFALLLLIIAWIRLTGAGTVVPLLALAGALVTAPVGAALGIDRAFSPAFFLLPGSLDFPLGAVLAVLLPIAALAATRRYAAGGPASAPSTIRFVVGTAAVAIGFAIGIRVLLDAAAPPLLASRASLWAGLQPAAALVLTVLAALALPPAARHRRSRLRLAPLVAGLGGSVALALGVLWAWRATQTAPGGLAALWALPFVLAAVGLARFHGRTAPLLRWLAAGWIAATAVVPHLWIAHVDARLDAAERELQTLGTRADPFADYLLRQFAGEAVRRSRLGEDHVELLYRAWVGSGLARAGYPVHLALWTSDRQPAVELALNGADQRGRSRAADLALIQRLAGRADAAGAEVVEVTPDVPGANQVLVAPLGDGRRVSAIVPPRRSLDRSATLAPFFGGPAVRDTRLTLVPTAPGDSLAADRVRWQPTNDRGWRSEVKVRYPDGDYHAHFELRLASTGVLFARGTLLLALDLALLGLLWFIGRLARGEPPRPPGGWIAGLGSFRARVTVALFVFFLLPTALFGAIAYRAVAGEVTRVARVVAEQAVTQAVEAFPQSNGDLRTLAELTGQEVLYYYRGELAQASSAEAVDLGLYGAWMPPGVFRTLASGEEPLAAQVHELAGQRYLLAYRPLPAAGTLAVPVSLAASDAAIRQHELAHLLLFAVLMGAVLSLTLSLAVGRSLSRPIARLRRAAAAVGAGELGVRLPEHQRDEFGDLFSSFNRMIQRLRRARAQEVRTARVVAWGEMARQVAHEIKNPLTPIKLSVQHVLRAHRDRRPDFERILESNADQILHEIEHLTEIARIFSRYGLPQEAAGPLESVDVGAVVGEVVRLYQPGDDGIEYRAEIDADLPAASARAGELKEVMLNLIENARAAMPDGRGTITISGVASGDGIQLRVGDDGIGIPADLLPRIFEPQFSTRSSGTGLGLAIVRRLVEGWGGSIDAESEQGGGTEIRIRLRPAREGVPAGGGAAGTE